MTDYTLKRLVTGPLQTNCYLLYDKKSRDAAIFDIAGPIDSFVEEIEEEELNVKYLFFTHGHFDHVMGCSSIKKQFTSALIGIHEQELDIMQNLGPFSRMFEFNPSSFGKPDILLDEGQDYTLGDLKISCILAPGHTPGSICFYFDNNLICGDVLFDKGIGRTDLYGGNHNELIKSIEEKLFSLPDKTIVYPGHGEKTTIGSEKADNPFIGSGFV